MSYGNKTTKVEYVKKPGFFERLGKSCSGVLVGLCMFLFSFIILYNNEGWSVETAVMLDEGLKHVVSLDTSTKNAFDGKLVHHQGYLQTDQEAIDPLLDLRLKCVSLRRKVETYQWVEYSEVKESDEGDKTRRETTYKYSTEWRKELIRSRDFDEEVGHRNPTEKLMADDTFSAPAVFVDGIRLPSRMLYLVNWYENLVSLPVLKDPSARRHLHYYYFGKDPDRPQVGDTRVWLQCAGIPQGSTIGQPDLVSVVARLNGLEFAPYKTRNGKTLEFLYRGSMTAKEIFDSQTAFNATRTWLLRGFGSILMFIALSIISRVIVTIFDWIPIVREIVTLSVTLFNFSLAVFLSLVTIAISWVRFRPLLASVLFAAACLPWYLSRQRARAYLSR